MVTGNRVRVIQAVTLGGPRQADCAITSGEGQEKPGTATVSGGFSRVYPSRFAEALTVEVAKVVCFDSDP
jgi:hypothetical protein